MKVPELMTFQEASTIPCAMVTAAFGLTLPYDSKAKLGGAGLKPFWEDGAKGCYKGRPIVVLGGSSSVGQFG
jgi:NADPH:quinone reductase-like Zn-dependent oxidoreductase